MRTIKFRGKRIDGGGWVVGFYQPHANGKVVFIGDYSGLTDIPKLHKVIPESVGQWTGLVDMDMAEAYEKDVVDVYFQDGDVERAVLIWDANRFRYQLKSSERSLWGFDDTLRFKIVGNLIDSPELMEVE